MCSDLTLLRLHECVTTFEQSSISVKYYYDSYVLTMSDVIRVYIMVYGTAKVMNIARNKPMNTFLNVYEALSKV